MNAWQQRVSAWFKDKVAPAAALPVRLGGRGTFASTTAVPTVRGFDQPLFWVVVALLLWGLVMVYSASIAMPDNPRFAKYSHTYFLTRHAMWLAISFVAALIASQIPIDRWEKAAPWLFITSLVLLIAVLIPGVGKVLYGARRCISIGPLGFLQRRRQAFRAHRFNQVTHRADLKGFQGKLVMGSAEDHRRRRLALAQLGRHLQAIEAGHADIQQDHVRPQAVDQRQRFFAVAGRGLEDTITLEFADHADQALAGKGFVIDDQHIHIARASCMSLEQG